MADQSLLQKYSTNEEVVMGGANAIAAHAGGGQGSATPVTKKWNRIDTIASDLDSCLLLAALVGIKQVLFNNTAATTNKTLSVYPQTGEKINGAINKQCNIPPGLCGIFESPENGNWYFKIGKLEDILFEVSLNITSAQLKTLYASPLDIIPAPGVGFAVEMVSGSGKYSKISINYSGGGQIMFIADTAGVNNYQLSDVTNPAAAGASYFKKFLSGSGDIIENKKIKIQAANSNFANGDGTYKVYGVYRIIQT